MIEILVLLFILYLFRNVGGGTNTDDDVEDFLMFDYFTDGEINGK